MLGAWQITLEHFQIAGTCIFLSGVMDGLDGVIARVRPQKSSFGGLLDSVLDRYSEGLIFMGLIYYFAMNQQITMILVAMVGLIGSY